MDCEGLHFSAPNFSFDIIVDDICRSAASWGDGNVVEDAISGLTTTPPSEDSEVTWGQRNSEPHEACYENHRWLDSYYRSFLADIQSSPDTVVSHFVESAPRFQDPDEAGTSNAHETVQDPDSVLEACFDTYRLKDSQETDQFRSNPNVDQACESTSNEENQHGGAPAQDSLIGNNEQHETQELGQVVQELRLEYQPVRHAAEHGDLSHHFCVAFRNEGGEELRSSAFDIDAAGVSPSTSKENSEQQITCSRKRAKDTTLSVDHNGVATRYDGTEERYTAYYRPSYWTQDDRAVFLGEHPTYNEAKDAYNLVALLHEEPGVKIDLGPFTSDRYASEMKRWKGKHIVDLVCELRLRGRGLLNDNTVNYKHVGWRWSGRKKGVRYFSTVSDDPAKSSNAKTGEQKRKMPATFDTPEQAARFADQVMVNRNQRHAWTNFPLSSYITSEDALPLNFLPLCNRFRDNLTHKRAKAWSTEMMPSS